jgi:hypothetical protein
MQEGAKTPIPWRKGVELLSRHYHRLLLFLGALLPHRQIGFVVMLVWPVYCLILWAFTAMQ